MRIILFFLLLILLIGIFPHLMLAVLVVNFVIGLSLSIMQIIFSYLPRYSPEQKNSKNPFFSILVPAHNEPPEILIDTLSSLSELSYKNFEVLVIDNNTLDSRTWKPVERYVKTLGARFKFFHVENLSGFKAGALNYVMQFVNPLTEYLAIVDADYKVNKDFLSIASSYFIDDEIALVQFPQHYRNCMKENKPIADEYGHFFGVFMNMANHMNCVPSTGTVSTYRLKPVLEIGGFRGEMLTEDADIGLRLHKAGYKGVYADSPVGYGLMPYDLETYRKQKWRWSYGNAQSLKTLFSFFGKISFKSWIGFLSHLMAWHNFLFLPFAVLATYSIILLPFIPILQIHRNLLYVSSLTIFITILSKYIIFSSSYRSKENRVLSSVRAFIVHMGMTLVYSEAWLSYLLKVKSPFVRTNKFISQKIPSLVSNTMGELILAIWFMIGSVEAMLWGRKFTIAAFLMTSSILFSVIYVYAKIMPTKKYSETMLIKLREKYRRFIV